MKRQDLIKLLSDLPADADIVFATWNGFETVDLVPSGCTPTGIDGVTRIGLKRPDISSVARAAVKDEFKR